MSDETYCDRLKRLFDSVSKCRLVTNRNMDGDAIPYFQRQCNAAQPRDRYEAEVLRVVHDLMRGSRMDFLICIRSNPWYVLITDARMILEWFRLEDIVSMRWNPDKSAYEAVPRADHDDDGRDEYAVRGRGGRGRGRGGRGRGGRGRGGRGGRERYDHDNTRSHTRIRESVQNLESLLDRLDRHDENMGVKRSPSIESIESDEGAAAVTTAATAATAAVQEVTTTVEEERLAAQSRVKGTWYEEVEAEERAEAANNA